MRFTVTVTDDARDELTELWLKATATRRRQITQASHFFDTQLRQNAHLKGILYSDDPLLRFLVKYPLTAYFEVSEADRMVNIFAFEEAPESA